MLVFVENIGHDFQGGEGWSLVESGGRGVVQIQRKKVLLLIHMMPPIMGVLGASNTPHDAPHVIFF